MIKYLVIGECWEFDGPLHTTGYGSIGGHGYAHREVYFMCNPDTPKHKHVLHTCDNPPCIRPEHLRAGTALNNMRDMTRKGRHGRTKLTPEDIRDIKKYRDMGVTQVITAKMYGVHQGTISRVLLGDTYGHVKGTA